MHLQCMRAFFYTPPRENGPERKRTGSDRKGKDLAMPTRLVAAIIALAALSVVSAGADAQDVARQPGAVYDFDRKGEKPAPAPKRELTGVWEPATGPSGGVQAT